MKGVALFICWLNDELNLGFPPSLKSKSFMIANSVGAVMFLSFYGVLSVIIES